MNASKKIKIEDIGANQPVQRRNTIQKKLVLDAVRNLKNHPTAEDVYKYILTTYNNISKGTVYRNLHMLVEENLINKVMVSDGADRFDHTITNHNHVKCEKCAKVYDVSSTELSMEKMITQDTDFLIKSGFIVSGYKIIFTGICPHCINKCQ